MFPDGLLTRLDDKLDALEAANKLSRPQLQEEDYVRGSANSASASSNNGAASSAGVAINPADPVSYRGPRQPLAGAVKDLTCQWSEAFHALASEGDSTSMCITAQMFLAPKGYGSVKSNRERGLQWLFKSIAAGDLEARAYARRACRSELLQWLATRDLEKAAADALLQDEAALAEAMERMGLKEIQVEEEEKRIVAEQQADVGE